MSVIYRNKDVGCRLYIEMLTGAGARDEVVGGRCTE